jgi:hypothetical protein
MMTTSLKTIDNDNDIDNNIDNDIEHANVGDAQRSLIVRDWINYYVTEFKFLADYAKGDANASLVLRDWISSYGLENTLKKTQDGTYTYTYTY